MYYGIQNKYKQITNITRTGYRALFLLKKLSEIPLTREEIIQLLQKDSIINKDLSKDTITYTINTLKKAGCVISRPTKKTNHKYILKSHPFNIRLKPVHVKALQSLRDTFATYEEWELLLYLSNLYIKLAKIAPDEESANIFRFKHPFKNIDLNIMNTLALYARAGKKAVLLYESPVHGIETLEFCPEFFTLERKNIYVWGYNLKYDTTGYLKIDHIKDIVSNIYSAPKAPENSFQKTPVNVKYILRGESASLYIPNEYEVLLKKENSKDPVITVRAEVSNKFNFYQRILSYGTDCTILEPEQIKDEFIKILKSIKAGYNNDR